MMLDKDMKNNRVEDEMPSKEELLCTLAYVGCIILIIGYFVIG